MAAEVPLALGPPSGHLDELWDPILPNLGMFFNFCFLKFSQKFIVWVVGTLGPSF